MPFWHTGDVAMRNPLALIEPFLELPVDTAAKLPDDLIEQVKNEGECNLIFSELQNRFPDRKYRLEIGTKSEDQTKLLAYIRRVY